MMKVNKNNFSITVNCKTTFFSFLPMARTLAQNAEGRVKSKTEKLAPVASLFNVHHLRPRAWLVGPV